MRQAIVFYKENEAGIISQLDDGSFTFAYNKIWLADNSKPAISLSLPKIENGYSSKFLFSFFLSLLPEGANKNVICKTLRIDKDDHFGLLINTATIDTIGAVTVEKI